MFQSYTCKPEGIESVFESSVISKSVTIDVLTPRL